MPGRSGSDREGRQPLRCCPCMRLVHVPTALPLSSTHLHPSTAAPPADRYVRYHEEWLKRCLLKIFTAPPRSVCGLGWGHTGRLRAGHAWWLVGAAHHAVQIGLPCPPAHTPALPFVAAAYCSGAPALQAGRAARVPHAAVWQGGVQPAAVRGRRVAVGGGGRAKGRARARGRPGGDGHAPGHRVLAWLQPLLRLLQRCAGCRASIRPPSVLALPCRLWAARARWRAACRRVARGTWVAGSRWARGRARSLRAGMQGWQRALPRPRPLCRPALPCPALPTPCRRCCLRSRTLRGAWCTSSPPTPPPRSAWA